MGSFDRTPIHGILGLTALLLDSQLTADQRESLMSVKECADLLLHIINSVLDLSKIEAGRLEVETVPFSIRKTVSSTLRMMEAQAHAHNLRLLWHIDSTVPDRVVGDPGKLQQCILNLGMLFFGRFLLVTLLTLVFFCFWCITCTAFGSLDSLLCTPEFIPSITLV